MMNKLLYTRYLGQLNNYAHQAPNKKALILLGYIQRDFIQYYRHAEFDAGITFIDSNIQHNRHLLKTLTQEQMIAQLHSFVDNLAHEGIQNHVEIYPFMALQQRYHAQLRAATMVDYQLWVRTIVHDFGQLMTVDGLSFSNRLESTLDIIYYINAHLYEKLTVKDVLQHASQYCNPAKAQRDFSHEMKMSISDFITVQRMQEAQRLLVKTDDAIKDIAKKLNFYDLNDFSKRFKRKIGMSPMAYRKEYQ